MSLPLTAVFLASVFPQQPTAGAEAFYQACWDATTDAVVMNVAAHPDDEAARSMVILRRRYGLRTVTVYTTCGDGGQNAIGREIGLELAGLRVRETLAAAAHTDTEVRWLGFLDFGYTKTMQEALDFWGKDKLLASMDATLRSVDPDLVITNHDLERGHGHHKASALAIAYACEQEQERSGRVVPLYERSGGFRGRPQETAEKEGPKKPVFTFDSSAVDALRGKTFARQAHEGLLEHATQGPWGAYNPTRLRIERWQQVLPKNDNPKDDLPPLARVRSVFDEQTFLKSLAAQSIDPTDLERDLTAFKEDRSRAEHVAEARRLLPILRSVADGIEGDGSAKARIRLARRMQALERILIADAGITMETWLPDRQVPVGGERMMRVAVHGVAVADLEIDCDGVIAKPIEETGVAEGWFAVPLRGDEDGEGESLLPDFTRTRTAKLRATFALDGIVVGLEESIIIELVEPIALRWDRSTIMVPSQGDWRRILSLEVSYRGDGRVSGPLRLDLPPGLKAQIIPERFALSADQRRGRALVRLTNDSEAAGSSLDNRADIRVSFGDSDKVTLEVQPFPGQIPSDLRIGLVRGPDDTVERFLEDMGITFAVLDEKTLAEVDLNLFSSLVLDMRVYHHRPDLANHRERMLKFCRSGGRVLALYHKPSEWGPRAGKPQLAPFPLRTGRRRVSQEDVPVTVLEPEHRLLHDPFVIREADFEGWVQERLLNVPSEYDDAWTVLLRMNDRGEDPVDGGLLYTDYGKGSYVFCSLALYRQLRRGHVGAARILLNLLTR